MVKYQVGDRVKVISVYTGRASQAYTVIKVSPTGKKVTISKPEFMTGQETFNFQPSFDRFYNDYSGTMVLFK